MKKFKTYIGILLASVTMFSCTKNPNFNYPDGTVGISKITTYPVITVTGAPYVYVAKGGTYADPGATAKAGTATVPVVASGVPNTSTAGVFTETYTATNTDGFSSSATRTVVVYATDATATGNDFSGKYLRAATGVVATWTKVAPGVYFVDNPGGAVGVNFQAITFNPTGYKITIPSQLVGGNATSSSTETTAGGAGGAITGYSLVILNPGYGTGLRTFVKQ